MDKYWVYSLNGIQYDNENKLTVATYFRNMNKAHRLSEKSKL